jgi:hypothetical protein
MRYISIAPIILLLLSSCNQKQQDAGLIKPDYMSEWIIANEDSLYNEFTNYVAENSLCSSCDTSWGEMAYQIADSKSYMGRFSIEAKKNCDSIEVTYFYNKGTNPKCRILLSTGYNKRLTFALDTIFTYPFTPKYFTIDKYEQPEHNVDIYRLNKTVYANVKELRIQMTPLESLTDLTIYVHSNSQDTSITNVQREFFIRQLFGEEALLKKINTVELRISDSIQHNLLTLDETLAKLK